jgi:hypothetical protein
MNSLIHAQLVTVRQERLRDLTVRRWHAVERRGLLRGLGRRKPAEHDLVRCCA